MIDSRAREENITPLGRAYDTSAGHLEGRTQESTGAVLDTYWTRPKAKCRAVLRNENPYFLFVSAIGLACIPIHERRAWFATRRVLTVLSSYQRVLHPKDLVTGFKQIGLKLWQCDLTFTEVPRVEDIVAEADYLLTR